eukprot:4618258-Pleurochrysis_carterae.AAC.1
MLVLIVTLRALSAACCRLRWGCSASSSRHRAGPWARQAPAGANSRGRTARRSSRRRGASEASACPRRRGSSGCEEAPPAHAQDDRAARVCMGGEAPARVGAQEGV